MAVEVFERRMRVLAAVAVIERYPIMAPTIDMGGGVRAFHVRYFGVPECVTDVPFATIKRDLKWLVDDGYLTGVRLRGFAGVVEYRTTLAGRAAVEQPHRREARP
jgi:hypothetical protein